MLSKYFQNKSLSSTAQREQHGKLAGSLRQAQNALSEAQAAASKAHQRHNDLLDAVASGEATKEKLREANEAVTVADAAVRRCLDEVAELQSILGRSNEFLQVATASERQSEEDSAREEFVSALRELADVLGPVYLCNERLRALDAKILAQYPNLHEKLPRYKWLPQLAAGGILTAWFECTNTEAPEALNGSGRATLAALREDRDRQGREFAARNSSIAQRWQSPVDQQEAREAKMRWEMLPEKQRAKIKLSEVLAQLREDRERRRKTYRQERGVKFDHQLQEQRRSA
jgi:hypothetical protein